MKSLFIARIAWFLALLLPVAAWAGSNKPAPATNVDSGSFGVFVNGKRIATETFSITQTDEGSVTKSQFKFEGNGKVPSSSELRLNKDGYLISYELTGDDGKSHSTVAPGPEVLKQAMTYPGKDKPDERQYILPPTTFILDDLAFVHREILVWRYIAGGCASPTCELKPETFGVLVPAEQTSISVKIALVGREKVTIHGHEVELTRFDLKSDAGESSLWLDQNHKMVRVLVPDREANTELVRD